MRHRAAIVVGLGAWGCLADPRVGGESDTTDAAGGPARDGARAHEAFVDAQVDTAVGWEPDAEPHPDATAPQSADSGPDAVAVGANPPPGPGLIFLRTTDAPFLMFQDLRGRAPPGPARRLLSARPQEHGASDGRSPNLRVIAVSPRGDLAAVGSASGWHLVALDGSDAARSPRPFVEGEPSRDVAVFSPDGRWLAFEHDFGLFMIDVESPQAPWLIDEDFAADLGWTGDSATVVYTAWEGVRAAPREGGPRVLFDSGAALVMVHPSGDAVLLDDRQLWSVPVAGGEPRALPIPAPDEETPYLAASDRLVYMGAGRLLVAPAVDGRDAREPPVLGSVARGGAFDASPDGRVAFTDARSGRVLEWRADTGETRSLEGFARELRYARGGAILVTCDGATISRVTPGLPPVTLAEAACEDLQTVEDVAVWRDPASSGSQRYGVGLEGGPVFEVAAGHWTPVGPAWTNRGGVSRLWHQPLDGGPQTLLGGPWYGDLDGVLFDDATGERALHLPPEGWEMVRGTRPHHIEGGGDDCELAGGWLRCDEWVSSTAPEARLFAAPDAGGPFRLAGRHLVFAAGAERHLFAVDLEVPHAPPVEILARDAWGLAWDPQQARVLVMRRSGEIVAARVDGSEADAFPTLATGMSFNSKQLTLVPAAGRLIFSTDDGVFSVSSTADPAAPPLAVLPGDAPIVASLDGRWLLLQGQRGVHLARTDGTAPETWRDLPDTWLIDGADFDPTSTMVLIQWPGGGPRVIELDATSDPLPLGPEEPAWPTGAAWLPDGRLLLAAEDDGLYAGAPDGTGWRRIADAEPLRVSGLVVSPDGMFVVARHEWLAALYPLDGGAPVVLNEAGEFVDAAWFEP